MLEKMERSDGFPEGQAPGQDNVSRLIQATLRISEGVGFDAGMQELLDEARFLTGSRYGIIAFSGDERSAEDIVLSGLTRQKYRRMLQLPGSAQMLGFLGSIQGMAGLRELQGYLQERGIPELRSNTPLCRFLPFLAAPVLAGEERLGFICLGGRAEEFAPEDRETLLRFAARSGKLAANLRRFRYEQRAGTGMEALVDALPVGVVILDSGTGMPVSLNRETIRIINTLNVTAGSLEEPSAGLTVRRSDGREVSVRDFPVVQALQSGGALRAEELTIGLPEGPSVTVLVNSGPLYSGSGALDAYLVTLQDLTPLEGLDRLRAEFLGIVAHELRGPLSSIKGSAATLLDESDKMDPIEMRQFFGIIDQQADQIRDLAGNLMDVARIETGTMPVAPEAEDVARLVEQARASFLQGGGRRNLAITLGEGLPPVMADRRRIAQVLNNLLTNAERFSPEFSAITIAAIEDGTQVAIAVSDQGRGVRPEALQDLFRRFTRLEGEGAGWKIAESGLGLSICKGIIEAHGGRIWADSDGPGQGTTITFTLPAAEKEATEPSADSPEWNGSPQPQPQRILALDDDPEALRYIRDTLTSAGFRPLVTALPNEAFSLIESHKPDLVLLDWLLPEVDGIALLPTILAISDAPVVLLSAYGGGDVIARAFEMGASDYVAKPFSQSELVARVRAALRRATPQRRPSPREPYEYGDLVVNYPERRITVAGLPVALTATEYDLLRELAVNAGMVLTHKELLQRVWGVANSGDVRLVRSVVKRLRDKLGDDVSDPRYIFTETRVGYRMPRPGRTKGLP